MKGCLAVLGIIAVLIVLAIVGAGGYAYYKGKAFSEQLGAAVAELEKTNDTFPWSAPPDGRLDPARMAIWFEVRSNSSGSIRKTLENVQSLEHRGENKKDPSFKDVTGFLGGMMGAVVEVPRDLASSLVPAKMSSNEFRWNSRTVLTTVFLAAKQGDPEAIKFRDHIDTTIRDAWSSGPGVESFRHAKERIEAAGGSFDPENLTIVLASRDRIASDAAVLILDCLVQDPKGFSPDQASTPASPPEAGK